MFKKKNAKAEGISQNIAEKPAATAEKGSVFSRFGAAPVTGAHAEDLFGLGKPIAKPSALTTPLPEPPGGVAESHAERAHESGQEGGEIARPVSVNGLSAEVVTSQDEASPNGRAVASADIVIPETTPSFSYEETPVAVQRPSSDAPAFTNSTEEDTGFQFEHVERTPSSFETVAVEAPAQSSTVPVSATQDSFSEAFSSEATGFDPFAVHESGLESPAQSGGWDPLAGLNDPAAAFDMSAQDIQALDPTQAGFTVDPSWPRVDDATAVSGFEEAYIQNPVAETPVFAFEPEAAPALPEPLTDGLTAVELSFDPFANVVPEAGAEDVQPFGFDIPENLYEQPAPPEEGMEMLASFDTALPELETNAPPQEAFHAEEGLTFQEPQAFDPVQEASELADAFDFSFGSAGDVQHPVSGASLESAAVEEYSPEFSFDAFGGSEASEPQPVVAAGEPAFVEPVQNEAPATALPSLDGWDMGMLGVVEQPEDTASPTVEALSDSSAFYSTDRMEAPQAEAVEYDPFLSMEVSGDLEVAQPQAATADALQENAEDYLFGYAQDVNSPAAVPSLLETAATDEETFFGDPFAQPESAEAEMPDAFQAAFEQTPAQADEESLMWMNQQLEAALPQEAPEAVYTEYAEPEAESASSEALDFLGFPEVSEASVEVPVTLELETFSAAEASEDYAGSDEGGYEYVSQEQHEAPQYDGFISVNQAYQSAQPSEDECESLYTLEVSEAPQETTDLVALAFPPSGEAQSQAQEYEQEYLQEVASSQAEHDYTVVPFVLTLQKLNTLYVLTATLHDNHPERSQVLKFFKVGPTSDDEQEDIQIPVNPEGQAAGLALYTVEIAQWQAVLGYDGQHVSIQTEF